MYLGFRPDRDPGSRKVRARSRRAVWSRTRLVRAAHDRVADDTMRLYLGNIHAALTTGRFYLVWSAAMEPPFEYPCVVKAYWPTSNTLAMTYYRIED